jgi:hypothetical protein
MQCHEISVFGCKFLDRNGGKSAVEIINAFYEVAGEALEGEVFGGLDLAFCALLEVAVVGDGTEVFVLAYRLVCGCTEVCGGVVHSYLDVDDFLVLLLDLLLQLRHLGIFCLYFWGFVLFLCLCGWCVRVPPEGGSCSRADLVSDGGECWL